MSLLAVAKKDFHDTARSRGMVVLVALFSLLVALFAYIVRPQGQADQFATELLLSAFVGPVLVTGLVPLVGVVVGYNAVSGERESGPRASRSSQTASSVTRYFKATRSTDRCLRRRCLSSGRLRPRSPG